MNKCLTFQQYRNSDGGALSHPLERWQKVMSTNFLKLNVKKTKTMLFCRDALTPCYDLTVENEMVEVVTSFKFLGITLDCDLSFDAHFRVLLNKLLKSSYVIRSLARIMPTRCLRPLHFAYYHSNLMYG